MMQRIKRASGMSPLPLVRRGPFGAAYVSVLLSEVEQVHRPSGNGDREAIVVAAGLCDGEGERSYTGYVPHFSFRILLLEILGSEKPDVNILNDGEYTFHAANGTPIIELFIVTDNITSWNFSLYTDTEVELFPGYANRGYVLVFVIFDITIKNSNRKTNFDLENADWDRWRETLEKEASN